MKKMMMVCCTALMLMAFAGCQSNEVAKTGVSGKQSSEASEMNASGNQTDETAKTNTSGNQRVGSEKTGYVDVPEDFLTFVNDVDLGEGVIQYSDVAGKNIVTLQYFDASAIDAEAAASSMYMQFANDTLVDQESLTAAMVTIDDCEAYQVYCYYPSDGVYVVTWSFDSPEDDYTHYVAVEFTEDKFDLFQLVESTYSVAK